MKNYLIITLGTRDVQLRKDLIEQSEAWEIVSQPDAVTGRNNFSIQRGDLTIPVKPNINEAFPDYFIISPRTVGKLVSENLSVSKSIIELPLIVPVIDFLAEEGTGIDCVMLIYTDQAQGYEAKEVSNFHYENDTLFFKNIATELLKDYPLLADAQFDEYGIFEQVVNIDHQYQHFAKAKQELLLENIDEVGEVILLPQGGIDQINHAITLQLIQAFKHKVRLLQKPGASGVVELRFTHQFLNDLNKQKVIKHLDDYDFGLITEELLGTMPHSVAIYRLARYAQEKLTLNHDHLSVESVPEFLLEDTSSLTRCRDLYLSAKIQFWQGAYGSYLMKLFTLQENLYKVRCEKVVGETTRLHKSKYDRGKEQNEEWHNFLKNCLSGVEVGGKSLYKTLQSAKFPGSNDPLMINNPNRALFQEMYRFLASCQAIDDSSEIQNLLEKIDKILVFLSAKRNQVAHRLSPINYDILVKTVGSKKTLKRLNSNLDQIFNLNSPFGIYDSIKADIQKLL